MRSKESLSVILGGTSGIGLETAMKLATRGHDLLVVGRTAAKLEEATSTLDAAGDVTATHDMAAVTAEQVADAAADLTGDLMQVPPMVSAIRIFGVDGAK